MWEETNDQSTELGTGNYTSAAGSPFTFSRNDTGVFVTSGNTTAQITASDVIINNGVVHLINAVLLNTESNAEAAEGAYTSATGAAVCCVFHDPHTLADI